MSIDAIVVGAGPAGCAAALTLSQAGARVLMLEKARLPRHKACGGALSPRAVHSLRRLGFAIDGSVVRVEKLVFRSVLDRSEVAVEYPDRFGAVISRFELDQWLVGRAIAEGVELREATTAEAFVRESDRVCGVRFRTAGARAGVVRAPVTLLAEGSTGSLAEGVSRATIAGRTRARAICRLSEGVEWKGPPVFEIHAPIAIEGFPIVGYGWIVPVSTSSAMVGVTWYAAAEVRTSLPHLLCEFEGQLRGFDLRFASARPVGRPKQGSIMVGSCASASYHPGLLLVGDCAGLASPFATEGIYQAVESGILAAQTVLHMRSGHGVLSGYASALTQMNLASDRMTSSLPVLYDNLRNVSRDLIPMLGERGAFGSAFRSGLLRQTAYVVPDTARVDGEGTLGRAVATAEERARRLGSRDREFVRSFLEEVEALPDLPPSTAATFLRAVRAARSSLEFRDRELRQGAACFALLRLAAYLLNDVREEVAPSVDGSRGGGWLAATLGLAVADRLLGRCFWVCSRLPSDSRRVLSEAIVDVFTTLSSEGANGRKRSVGRLAEILDAAAQRAGMQIAAQVGALSRGTDQ